MHGAQASPPSNYQNDVTQPSTPAQATPAQALQHGVCDSALFDKPPLPAAQQVSSHVLSSLTSQRTASVSSAEPPATGEPLGRRSLGEASEVSTVPKQSLSDGIPPVFETTSSYDGSATAVMSGIGRRFSIHLQTGLAHSRLVSVHALPDLACFCHT